MKPKIQFNYTSLPVILMLVSIICQGQDIARLQHTTVTGLDGKIIPLSRIAERPAVYIVLGTDCPVSQKYMPVIEGIKKKFSGKIEIILLFPISFSLNEVRTFKKEFKATPRCYIDHTMQVTDILNATVTPEAFLLSRENTLLYSGAIDNWFYDLGKYRSEVTQHYLMDAIVSFLKDEKVLTARTEPIGCLIQRKSNVPQHVHDHH